MGGPDIPKMQQAPTNADYGLNNIAGGQDLLKQLQGKMNQGLDPSVLDAWKKSNTYATNKASTGAFNSMKEQTAGKMLPTGSLVRPMTDLYGQLQGQNLQANQQMGMADQTAKQQNFWNSAGAIPGLSTSAYDIGAGKYSQLMKAIGMNNQTMTNQFGMEKENSFDWGGFLGQLMQTGAKVGTAFI
jgi:hypothetical protein